MTRPTIAVWKAAAHTAVKKNTDRERQHHPGFRIADLPIHFSGRTRTGQTANPCAAGENQTVREKRDQRIMKEIQWHLPQAHTQWCGEILRINDYPENYKC